MSCLFITLACEMYTVLYIPGTLYRAAPSSTSCKSRQVHHYPSIPPAALFLSYAHLLVPVDMRKLFPLAIELLSKRYQ